MAIKIKFDTTHNPEMPTLILARRNGDKIGMLNAKDIEVSDSLKDASEITFKVYKYIDDNKCDIWEQITDFKLVYCVEWDVWFEITVEINEENETIKTVFCKRLGQAELSQIMLYNIEINTENDIAREEYVIPTVLYNEAHPESSLLHRIMEKARHYSVIHVDDTIKNIQRTFTFDGTSIYDAFQSIAEEIHCLFVFNSNSDENGKIQRTISVYDLESNCIDCGHRGEFTNICPKCSSSNINEGYGNDTTIFVTSDEIADSVQLTTDTDSVKNCFKLKASDGLMAATIRNCNPNGTDYIWYFTDSMKNDMSTELKDKIQSYSELFSHYQKEYIYPLDDDMISKYNALVQKYNEYNEDLELIEKPVKGYPSLMNVYYNTIDLEIYLKSALMPTVSMSDTSAIEQSKLLTVDNLSPVAVPDIEKISILTANSAVLAMAKVVIDSRYRIKVESSELNSNVWTGSFSLVNYSDDTDSAISDVVSVNINGDYSSFVKQKLQKALKKDDVSDLSISGLFKMEYDNFVSELKKYGLDSLNIFYNSCQTCIDILIEQGVADKETWSGKEPNLYDDLYMPYLKKLSAIESEIKVRQDEINLITGVYDGNGDISIDGVQTCIERLKEDVQSSLDFESYLGNDLWIEFCSFRRDGEYSNDNYISDGLNNAELFKKAYEFVNVAQDEIYKSAELQHSISATLKNLLMIKKFEPIVKDFQIGNWIRVLIDDEIYKLRLIKYSINYNQTNELQVEFADVVNIKNSIKSIQDVISKAGTMATSYSYVKRQAKQGEKSNYIIDNWSKNGLNTTNTKIIGGADNQNQMWDEHGMLFKKYDSISDTYDDTQLKIINSTLAITDDNWNTVKTAIGSYYYFNPETQKLTMAYGVNAEVIVGNLILGEKLGIYNKNGSMSYDENGLMITNGTNSFRVDPNSDVLLAISNKDKDVFFIDNNGKLHLTGDGTGVDISENAEITDLSSKLTSNTEAITEEIERATGVEAGIDERVTANKTKIDSFKLKVTNNNDSSTIALYAGDTEVNSQEMKFNDVVTNSLLSSKYNITSDAANKVTIGGTGKNVYLTGNVYINGVLYTG